MNRIWGSSYGNNDIKKISDRVNFKIGQTIYGKLVKKIDVNQAIIRLLNGVELHAEIEEGIDDFKQGLLKFQVQGLRDNKLQLRLFNIQSEANNSNIESDLMSFIIKEGLEKSDLPILEGMLKYDISLTKENIRQVKTLLQFSERMIDNPNGCNEFIEKYLSSKEIDSESFKGKEITSTLKNFFKEFSNMSIDDILLFIENDLEFTEDSIKSYNSIFKEDLSIANTLKEMNSNIETFQSVKNNKEEVINIQNEIKTIENDTSLNENINIKDYKENTKESLNKISNLINNTIGEKNGILTNTTKSELNIILKENGIVVSAKEDKLLFETLKDIPTKDLEKVKVEEVLEKITGKPVVLTEESAEVIKKIFSGVSLEENNIDGTKDIKEQIRVNVDSKTEEAKDIIKKTIELLSSDKDNISELMSTIKDSMAGVKLFNKISEEYYYMDIPMNFNENEYPCKLIIKDKRKDGKEIDSKNLKLALSVKTINFGTVDAFVKVLNKTIDIEFSCDEKSIKKFEKTKEILKKRVEDIGFFVNINIKKRENEEFDITKCRGFFGENNIAAIDIKV